MNKLLIIILFATISLGLAWEEAQLYGSRILVCQPNNTTIRYWQTTKQDNNSNFKIFDLMKKRLYPANKCELYKCSSSPDRIYKCTMP